MYVKKLIFISTILTLSIINIAAAQTESIKKLQQNTLQTFINDYHAKDCINGVCWHAYKNNTTDRLGWWNTANLVEIFTNYLALYPTAKNLQNYINEEHAQNPPSYINNGGYYDDRLWWVLAYLRVYQVYKAYNFSNYKNYLADATNIFDQMTKENAWDDTYCNGGVWWTKNGTHNYKNAITNEQFFAAAAKLAAIYYQENDTTNATKYLAWAEKEWYWLTQPHNGHTIIRRDYAIENGFHVNRNTGTCQETQDQIWTYNQGVILAALLNFSYDEAALNPKSPLIRQAHDLAIKIANAAISSRYITQESHGKQILVEVCEFSATNPCNNNEMQFKGIFTRYLNYFANMLSSHDKKYQQRYQKFIKDNVHSLAKYNTDDQYHFGLHWLGPYNPYTNTAYSNLSALDAFIAMN